MIGERPQGLFRSPAHLSDRSQDLFAVVPHMIAGLAVGSAVAAALNAALGPGRTGIETLAALPRGLPPLSLPDVSAESFR